MIHGVWHRNMQAIDGYFGCQAKVGQQEWSAPSSDSMQLKESIQDSHGVLRIGPPRWVLAHKVRPNNAEQRMYKREELVAKLTDSIQNLSLKLVLESIKEHEGWKGWHIGSALKCWTTNWHTLQFVLSSNPAKVPRETSNVSPIRPFDQLVIASAIIWHPRHCTSGSISFYIAVERLEDNIENRPQELQENAYAVANLACAKLWQKLGIFTARHHRLICI